MKDGILLVDKPAGVTSAAVVATLKRRLRLESVGHAGTLDPMATGLLVCLAGGATRLAGHASGGEKIYSGVIRFGVISDTDDITGTVTATGAGLPSFDLVS